MQNKDKIKMLKSKLSKQQKELALAEDEKRLVSRKISNIKSEIRNVETSIKYAVPKNPIVSDHAIVRYFERVMGIDIQMVKDEILTDKIKNCMASGSTGYFDGKVDYVFKNNVLITLSKRDKL